MQDLPTGSRQQGVTTIVVVLVLYSIITVVMLFPFVPVWRIGSDIQFGDAALTAYILAWDNHALLHQPLEIFNATFFYPHRNTLAYTESLIGVSLLTLPIWLLTHNPVLSYNVVLYLVHLLSALTMFLLCNHLVKNKFAAFIGGLIFAFNSDNMWHSAGHINLVSIMWMPLVVLFIWKYMESAQPRYLVGAGLFLVWQVLSSWYLGVLTLYVLACVLLYRVIENWRDRGVQRGLVILGTVGVALLICAPVMRQHKKHADEFQRWRTIGNAIGHSADFGGYLLPPTEANRNITLVGHLVKSAVQKKRLGENNQFLGYIPLALLCAEGLIVARRWRRKSLRSQDRTSLFFIGLLLLSGLISFGPFLIFLDRITPVRLPFYYLFTYLPPIRFMRGISRFSIVVYLCLGLCCSSVLSRFFSRIRISSIQTFGLTGLLSCVILLEYWVVQTVPTFYFRYPETHQWIAKQPDEGAIVELPPNDSIMYFFSSTLHWRPIWNGYVGSPNMVYEEQKKLLYRFPDLASLDLLRELGIVYIIVHGQELVERARQSPYLSLDFDGGSDGVFSLMNEEEVERVAAAERQAYRRELVQDHARLARTYSTLNFEFDRLKDSEGWEAWHAMTPFDVCYGVATSQVKNVFAFCGRVLAPPIPSRAYAQLEVRMKLSNLRGQNTAAKLYWLTPTRPMDEVRTMRIPTVADGQFHTYAFDLFSSRVWTESQWVAALRLDPYEISFPGLNVAIDYIRLKTEPGPAGE